MQRLFLSLIPFIMFSCGGTSNSSQGGRAVTAENAANSYVVGVLREEKNDLRFCTGVLIKQDLVLTTAACISESNEPLSPSRIFVVKTLGSVVSSYLAGAPYHVKTHHVQPQGELAILKLNEPVKNASPVEVARAKWWDNTTSISLFGYDQSNLRTVNATLTSIERNRRELPLKINNLEQFIFVSNRKNRLCESLSGGPALAVHPKTKKSELIGIASQLNQNSSKSQCKTVGLYINVVNKSSWIESILKKYQQ